MEHSDGRSDNHDWIERDMARRHADTIAAENRQYRMALAEAQKRIKELERYLSPADFDRMAFVAQAHKDLSGGSGEISHAMQSKDAHIRIQRDQMDALERQNAKLGEDLARARDAQEYWKHHSDENEKEIIRLNAIVGADHDKISALRDGMNTLVSENDQLRRSCQLLSEATEVAVCNDGISASDAPILPPMLFDELIDNLDGFFALSRCAHGPVKCFILDRRTHKPIGRVSGIMYRDNALFIMSD